MGFQCTRSFLLNCHIYTLIRNACASMAVSGLM